GGLFGGKHACSALPPSPKKPVFPPPLLRRLLGRLRRVPLERPGRGKLTQLVTDHVLGDVHRNEFLAVMNRECVPDKVRNNGRTARPGSYYCFLVLFVQRSHLFQQVVVGERSFF